MSPGRSKRVRWDTSLHDSFAYMTSRAPGGTSEGGCMRKEKSSTDLPVAFEFQSNGVEEISSCMDANPVDHRQGP